MEIVRLLASLQASPMPLSGRLGSGVWRIEADADRDYWLTASEAKAYGLIDEVLVGRKK